MDWLAAESFTESSCADVFDNTPCTLVPRKKGLTANHTATNDDGRPLFDFMATIELQPPSDRLARHMSSDTGVRNGTVSYEAVITAHSGLWPYRPQRGDHVVSGADRWEITADEQDGSIRLVFYLVRA